MIRFAFRALLMAVLLLGCGQDQAFGQAAKKGKADGSKKGSGARGKTQPETSKVADFDAAALTKFAVLVVGNKDLHEQTNHQRIAEDVFLECLLAKGHTVVARSDVDSVFKEKRFQASGMTEDLATSVGKLLNVPAVMIVRITEDSAERTNAGLIGRASIGARLLNVESGAIVWNGKHSDAELMLSQNAVSGLVLKTAAALAEAFPEKKPIEDISSMKVIDPKSLPKLAVIMTGGEKRPTLGMRDVSHPQSDLQRQVEDQFIQVLIDKGYRLVSRSDMQSVAKEQQFQKSGLTEDNAVAVGKLLNVPAVLLVRITDYAAESFTVPQTRRQAAVSRVALGARLVDVNKGEIWWTHGSWVSKEVGTKGDTTRVLDAVAKEVATFFPPAPETKKTILDQAVNLERIGQMTEALIYYRTVSKNSPGTPEGKRADARIKVLTGLKAAASR